ncbi:unnamed protein product [Paramecium pentaurelia]|uniref:cAMP-dependent protein kinase regulatory subunit n=1 Tax=Paramecium pentaurelia TaxID=43138 RepID=A0A8S1V5L7_9CILI|nr:unnamed protein product [Paramecium pentaurelia]
MNPQKVKNGPNFMQQLNKKKHVDCALSSNSESSDDEVDEIVAIKKDVQKQRFSVSAEAYGQFNKKENFKAKFIPKSKEQSERIKQRMQAGFMFSALNDKEIEIVVGAMEEKIFHKAEYVIKQGEEGNVLYVVDTGELDCFKNYGKGDIFLKTYYPGESFGELALLFQSPRAASIIVKSDKAILWQLDRETFNLIVKEASIKKRQQFENFLENWDLLKEIKDPYDRLKMSDALFEKQFKKGDIILQQGQKSNEIFIVEQGRVGVNKNNQKLFELTKLGDYFGDQSIVAGTVESFTYVAEEEIKLMYIPKKSYSSTLKEIEGTLMKNIQIKYGKYL